MARHARSLTAVLFVLVAAALAAPGCADTSCTLVACADQITFQFDETLPRDYVVTVTVGGLTGTADCTAAVSADTTSTLEAELQGDLTGLVECGTDHFAFRAAPAEVTIALEYPDGTRTDAYARPVYDDQYPNGEDCGIGCRTTEVAIDAHGPGGA